MARRKDRKVLRDRWVIARAEEARRQGGRTWETEAHGLRLIVKEVRNDAETAASRNSGRLYFYYGAGAPRLNYKGYLQLERALLPHALEAAGVDPDVPRRRRADAGCYCRCSPGFLLKDPSEKWRELLVEVLPIEETDR